MIIVLEGLNGAGKTTYAEILSAKLRLPIYRPFREGNLTHESGLDKALMANLGVPINSYQEDIYLSDYLAKVKNNIILDRSFPSALLYGTAYGTLPNNFEGMEYLFGVWNWNMERAGAKLIWLNCGIEVAKQRCSHKKFPLNIQQFQKLSNLSHIIFTKAKFDKMAINTETIEVEDGIKRILPWLE